MAWVWRIKELSSQPANSAPCKPAMRELSRFFLLSCLLYPSSCRSCPFRRNSDLSLPLKKPPSSTSRLCSLVLFLPPPASPSISVVLYRKIIPRIVCFVFAAIPACRYHSGQPSSSTSFSCSLVAPFLQTDSSTWATVVPHQNVTHARRFRNQTMKRTPKAIVKTTQIMAITSLPGIVLGVKCEVDDTGLCKYV